MRQDLYGAMKNAIARGQDLNQVVNSFIAAGYPKEEVIEIAEHFNGGALKIIDQRANAQQEAVQNQAQQQAQQNVGASTVNTPQYWTPEQYEAWYRQQPPGTLPPGKYMPPGQYRNWYNHTVAGGTASPVYQQLANVEPPSNMNDVVNPAARTSSKNDNLFPEATRKRKNSSAIKIMLLVVLLFGLLGALGASILYRDEIIEFINGLL